MPDLPHLHFAPVMVGEGILYSAIQGFLLPPYLGAALVEMIGMNSPNDELPHLVSNKATHSSNVQW